MPHHILTIWMEPWGFIKPSASKQVVHIELSLRLSFYQKMQPWGLHGGQHCGIPSRDRGAFSPTTLPPNPSEVTPIKRTYCTSRREDIFYRSLNGRLRGYCRSKMPRVPLATGYNPKFWISSVPSSGKWSGNHTHRIR
jgi:hypothetical protein